MPLDTLRSICRPPADAHARSRCRCLSRARAQRGRLVLPGHGQRGLLVGAAGGTADRPARLLVLAEGRFARGLQEEPRGVSQRCARCCARGATKTLAESSQPSCPPARWTAKDLPDNGATAGATEADDLRGRVGPHSHSGPPASPFRIESRRATLRAAWPRPLLAWSLLKRPL